MLPPYVASLILQHQSRCQGNISAIRSATRIPDVVRLSHVNADAMIKSLVKREQVALNNAAERRIEAIMQTQIKCHNDCDNVEKREQLIQSYLRDWQCLRGNFPRLAQLATRLLSSLRHTNEPL